MQSGSEKKRKRRQNYETEQTDTIYKIFSGLYVFHGLTRSDYPAADSKSCGKIFLTEHKGKLLGNADHFRTIRNMRSSDRI